MRSRILILFLLFAHSFFAQKADSLINVIAGQKEDTNKVNSFNALAWEYYLNESDVSLKHAQQALKLAETLHYDRGIATALNTIGIAYYFKSNYPLALESYIRAVKILEAAPATSVKKLSALYNNIATVLLELRRLKDAEEYFFKSLKADGEMGDKLGMSQSYNNIGLIYKEQGNYEKALDYYLKAYALRKEIKDHDGMPSTLTNIGVAYTLSHNTKLGQRYLDEAVQQYRQNKDTLGLAIGYNSLGDLEEELKEYDKAVKYYDSSLKISLEKGYLAYTSYSYSSLALVNGKMKNFEKAFEYHRKYMRTKDSIYNKESAQQLNEMQTKYETEKKEKELLQTKAESEKQTMLRNFFIGGFGIMIILAFLILRGYRNKQRLNVQITAQKKEVELQKELIEEKQKEILDSIYYARRIQQSLLPGVGYIERNIKHLKDK